MIFISNNLTLALKRHTHDTLIYSKEKWPVTHFPYFLIVKFYDNVNSIVSELICMQGIPAVCYQSF